MSLNVEDAKNQILNCGGLKDDFDDEDELYEQEQMIDNLDKSIDFYEDNSDKHESPCLLIQ